MLRRPRRPPPPSLPGLLACLSEIRSHVWRFLVAPSAVASGWGMKGCYSIRHPFTEDLPARTFCQT